MKYYQLLCSISKDILKNIGFRNVNLAYLSKINPFNTILKNKEKLYIPLDKKY